MSLSTSFALRGWLAVAVGIVEAAPALRRGEGWGERAIWALTGLVSIALGVVLFIRPDIGALSLATVFGLFSVVYGISRLMPAFQARKAGAATHRLASAA